ncbi:MAG TPA: 50S ribosomal protein L11 methyltransferase [Xanthobacteraceae bacterium]|nr:50S ribosomal protein L11 methyltransferase [Xanthobacteraceae bacterium]
MSLTPMSSAPDRPTLVARLVVDEPSARRLVAGGGLDDEGTAVSAYDAGDGRWVVEVLSGAAPARSRVHTWAARAGVGEAAITLLCEPVADRDWVALSLAGLGPVEAGRFLVHGRHDRARTRGGQVRVEVEAAAAFGSGHHGTTRGCLLALDRILKARRPARTTRVLDLGTGSGVLAIAAAKALRATVAASDIDRAAVRIAQANVVHNGVRQWVEVVHGAGVRAPRLRGPFDLVLANILLGPLLALAAPMADRIAPGGRAIVSGLLPGQANAVLAAYRRCGLALERRIVLAGWATLLLTRPPGRPQRPVVRRPREP